MPYQHEQIKLPRALDRRVKLNEQDRLDIKALYEAGAAIRAIASKFSDKCCRRSIQFVLFPERLIAAKANRDWTRYYNKAENTEAIRETRRYKQKVLKPVVISILDWFVNITKGIKQDDSN